MGNLSRDLRSCGHRRIGIAMLTLIILPVGVLLSWMLPQRSTEGRLPLGFAASLVEEPKGSKKSQKAHGTKVNPCGETAGRIFLLRSTYSEYFVLIPKACENTKFSENYFCCNLSCYKFSQFSAFRAFSESNILNRGAGPGGVPAGTCPYVISESDVGLAGPVGVDSDTNGGGGAAT